ncbi:hypothetical protein [Erysipelothrix rhusiopathiae]|uniref:hypothetical protein n=1 Tax=Erysipelothrix phage SE-1 TaxID=1675317 RepID=UPI00065F49AA|nr:hypothetical protein [Erysipelothrix rhusiopathiae]YP_009224257.1 hypothetical protein AXI73_gp32 [Erysipelothrix phage SE-1]AKQ06891.1 hypothetical protein [Erysipelothrix phage SE-1]MDV7685122.1 hypothetical protein [Erysipelothrix rhusiopathiae]
MILTLKNGTNIKLEWNYLVLEYLEEREGSIELLQDRINELNTRSQVRLSNSFVYAVIQANHDDVLTYKQAIRLVNPNDYGKVFNFIKKQLEIQKAYKKKETSKKSGNRSQKRKRR